MNRDLSREMPRDMQREMPKDYSRDMQRDAYQPRDMQRDISREMPRDLSRDMYLQRDLPRDVHTGNVPPIQDFYKNKTFDYREQNKSIRMQSLETTPQKSSKGNAK